MEANNPMMINDHSRADRDRFPDPLEPMEDRPGAGEPSFPEPEESSEPPKSEPSLPDGPDPPDAGQADTVGAEAGGLILQPLRPAERRATEFLPQWLKRQGRAWPG